VIDDEIFFVFVLNLESLVVTILVTYFVNIFLFHHVQDLVIEKLLYVLSCNVILLLVFRFCCRSRARRR
jgi:hypothetical protein